MSVWHTSLVTIKQPLGYTGKWMQLFKVNQDTQCQVNRHFNVNSPVIWLACVFFLSLECVFCCFNFLGRGMRMKCHRWRFFSLHLRWLTPITWAQGQQLICHRQVDSRSFDWSLLPTKKMQDSMSSLINTHLDNRWTLLFSFLSFKPCHPRNHCLWKGNGDFYLADTGSLLLLFYLLLTLWPHLPPLIVLMSEKLICLCPSVTAFVSLPKLHLTPTQWVKDWEKENFCSSITLHPNLCVHQVYIINRILSHNSFTESSLKRHTHERWVNRPLNCS